MRVPYYQVHNGELMPLKSRRLRLACCDCGLVHDLVFKITNGRRISYRAYKNGRATGGKRKAKGIRIVKVGNKISPVGN